MAFDAHKNFAVSLVATAPSPAASGTSLIVTAGEGARFPAVPFNAVVFPAGQMPTPANAEIVRVTARSTDTLTITRAQESSVARTIVVGDAICAAITLKTLTDIEAGTNFPLITTTGNITGAVASFSGVVNAATAGTVTAGFVNGFNMGSWDMFGYNAAGTKVAVGGYRSSQWLEVGLYTSGNERLNINTSGVVTLSAYTAATFVAGDKYVVVDANGVLHRSALGPAS